MKRNSFNTLKECTPILIMLLPFTVFFVLSAQVFFRQKNFAAQRSVWLGLKKNAPNNKKNLFKQKYFSFVTK